MAGLGANDSTKTVPPPERSTIAEPPSSSRAATALETAASSTSAAVEDELPLADVPVVEPEDRGDRPLGTKGLGERGEVRG